MKQALVFFLCLSISTVYAQQASQKKLTFSAYGEMYYSFDFSKPSDHDKAAFLYNHKRHNELNANLLLAKASFQDDMVRANLGIMTGNYAEYNLSAEPTWAQFIYEGNIGVKLSKKHNTWLDAGILPSHLGFESAIGADCWTLTRGLYAENSPYFETGVKLSNTSKNGKLLIAAMYLNGWQRVKKPDGIQKPSWGFQINYKATEKLLLNYSNFIGTDKPDSLAANRHFHNIYAQYEPTEKTGIIAGFDIGSENGRNEKNKIWYCPVIIVKQKLSNKTTLAIRGEYFYDREQVIITTSTSNGFQTYGLSANLDYDIHSRIKIRVEGKMFESKDSIFSNNTKSNYSLTSCLAVRF
jgi:hypothetical protein